MSAPTAILVHGADELLQRLDRMERKIDQLTSDAENETPAADSDRLLKPDVVQKRLQVSRTTLWQLRRRGELKAVAIGRAVRFRESDVDALLNKRTPVKTE
jgi:excisionase family DNA binding protein